MISYEGFIFGYPEVMAYVRDRIDEAYSLLRPDAFAYPMLAEASWSSNYAAYDIKFTYEILATVPKGYAAVCGGEFIRFFPVGSDSTSFIYHSKIPTKRIDLAVAQFRVLADSASHVFIYHLPADSLGATRVLGASRKVISLYSGIFGWPKHYHGYTVIEIPDGWGSQASDFYFLQTSAAFKDSARLGEVYHEIGHSWNATPSPSIQRCRYFDEAFASYFESLAIRKFEGEQRFKEDMENTRAFFAKRANDDRQAFDTPIAEYGKNELGGNSYTKGSWSLYVLEQIVGEKLFAEIIRSMLGEYENKKIDFDGFQKLCERISRKSLRKYFDEWIYGTESSKLLVDGVSITDIVKRY
jgi:aminopeptidase N